jgi:hypothetical protein
VPAHGQPDPIVQSKHPRRSAGHGREGNVCRKSVIMGLLSLIEQITTVEDGMVALE